MYDILERVLQLKEIANYVHDEYIFGNDLIERMNLLDDFFKSLIIKPNDGYIPTYISVYSDIHGHEYFTSNCMDQRVFYNDRLIILFDMLGIHYSIQRHEIFWDYFEKHHNIRYKIIEYYP